MAVTPIYGFTEIPMGGSENVPHDDFVNAVTGTQSDSIIQITERELNNLNNIKSNIYAKTTAAWNADTTTVIRSGEFGIDITRGVARMGDDVNVWSGLVDYLPSIPILTGSNPPTHETIGEIGQLYLHTDTDIQRFYVCHNVNPPTYTWDGIAYLRDLEDLGGTAADITYDDTISEVGADNVQDAIDNLHTIAIAKANPTSTLSHTLTANWPGGQQTIPIPGLTSTTPGILYISTLASLQATAAWMAARPVLTQEDGVLTVTVSVAPTVDIPIVIRLDSGEGSIQLDSDLPIKLLGQAGGFAGLDAITGRLPNNQLVETGALTPQIPLGVYTYGPRGGVYVKIGNLVHCAIQLAITGITTTGTGQVLITGGMPYARTVVYGSHYDIASILTRNINVSGILVPLITSSNIVFYVQATNGTYTTLQYNALTATAEFYLSYSYYTAS